ncbi:MAG: hypothetical protein ACR2PW_01855 [Gammaproteobacteria bacterium]
MPEITVLGWAHTAAGVASLLVGFYCLARYHFISLDRRSGMLYLGLTVFTAVTALAIYQHGGFNVAHLLAVMTLLAVATGAIAEKTNVLRIFSPYMQAASYSATFLFHMVPAITDGLRRLPVDSPIVTEPDDPLLLGFYGAFLLTYLLGLGVQWLKIYRSS